jgi:uncharacterized membrane protein
MDSFNATNVLKFFHILFAATWVGGGVMLHFLLYRAAKVGPEAMGTFNEMAEWTSNHVFMPSSFLTLGFGIATVAVGGYDWGAPWIGIGFTGFIISAILGMAVLGPTSKKMKTLVADRGPNDPVVAHLARRMSTVGKIDTLILIIVVAAMVFKPS